MFSVCMVNTKQRPATHKNTPHKGLGYNDVLVHLSLIFVLIVYDNKGLNMSLQNNKSHIKVNVAATRKYKDEEGTDSTDDADDVAHVRYKHGNDKREGDPGHRENNSTAILKRMSDDSPVMSANS